MSIQDTFCSLFFNNNLVENVHIKNTEKNTITLFIYIYKSSGKSKLRFDYTHTEKSTN